MANITTISAQALTSELLSQGVLLDIRTRMEHAEKHLAQAHIHVPLEELNPVDFMLQHGLDQHAKVYLLCRSGQRARVAAEKFIAAGYNNVCIVEGGLIACEHCDHPVEGHLVDLPNKSKQTSHPISLERQVRIAAGLFAAVGAALGLFVHPAFTVIPLFVGCGLIFAGVTDRCGMALLLTKAPWNKI